MPVKLQQSQQPTPSVPETGKPKQYKMQGTLIGYDGYD
jgi:hypothetical protein